ncbi:hypothetical protein [Amycolatopsis jejuensis]|uniref:hypothetical protein n=1 Tax=Amycolatopsis jejuensis TaxID=330084 RepID=UPI0005261195|nr:hypothetical protein [Amycolatopsis jejuensis]
MASEDDDVRALFAQTPDGPPMQVDAADLIVRGAAVRRRRKRWAVAGSSAATVAVLAVAGFAVGHREPAPVMPAGPGLATVPSSPPSSSSPSSSSSTPPSSPEAPSGPTPTTSGPSSHRDVPGTSRSRTPQPPRTGTTDAPPTPNPPHGSTALPTQTSR